ncbi:MAG: YlbF family regulator [Oscillospiraceae bacterium]|nr:YlbF family regulator [Oscillospiraceae bacterium]MCD7803693.1 YlbF family regulator [Oscillospiraceae bacterium]MCD7889577.1 YlbF family regulator [Oscillospiraceae bacterium]
MDVIQLTRELGKAIQADERYSTYIRARVANDNDTELQKMIEEFNRGRTVLNNEVSKTTGRDENKVEELKTSVGELYSKIMKNENMSAYNDAKNAMDELLRQITTIISMSANGEDPETCDMNYGCTGNCASCGGCH